jgi:hypothetical protein
MLVATITFLESGGEGSKTSICSVMESPECRGIGLRRSVFSGSLGVLIEFTCRMHQVKVTDEDIPSINSSRHLSISSRPVRKTRMSPLPF